ncbi:unnamed protein product [Haemonchus placei]|uniref:WD_REPEATS_REGION domain-containing protein n=1 Tax=Haemonchus placei TaxID=6290 RepID=A0A0N4WJF4_HAEPC|nr:unnamed protein product [Haemonchus placei]
MYSPYMDLGKGFYTARPSTISDRNQYNDLLRAENESLRVRVTELEKIVDRQQSELMLLQTTSADLLRRMAKLEISSSPANNGIGSPSSKASPKVTARLPPRNISQSSYNIAKTASPSRNGLSRSLHVHNSREACIDENPGPQVSPASLKRQTSAAIVNVSVGKSSRGSPLRKWMSHQNVKGSPTSGAPLGDLSVSGRTTPSVCSPSRNLSSWTVSRSVSCNTREPIFNASSHVLQLQVAGRSVAVPVPESIENIDPAAEQPPPDCPPPQIEWAYEGNLQDRIFSGGNLLACTDESYTHLLSVWKWSDEVKLAEAKGANDQIFAVSWHPLVRNLIVMCGRGHFSFWQFDAKNETLTKNVAIFEGRDKPKTLLSMCFSETGDVITGDSNGTLSLWDPITFKTKKQVSALEKRSRKVIRKQNI